MYYLQIAIASGVDNPIKSTREKPIVSDVSYIHDAIKLVITSDLLILFTSVSHFAEVLTVMWTTNQCFYRSRECIFSGSQARFERKGD